MISGIPLIVGLGTRLWDLHVYVASWALGIRCPGRQEQRDAEGHPASEPLEAVVFSSFSGCIYKLGVFFVGAFRIRAPLFGLCIRAFDSWKLPNGT